MKTRTFLVTAVLLVTALAGCSGGEWEDVLLADFDFSAQRESVFRYRFDAVEGVHWFGEGFSGHEGKGVWTLQEEARVHLYTLGERVQLEFDVATSEPLAEAGQTVQLVWNGYDLGTRELTAAWQTESLVVRIPAEAVVQGMNELVVRSGLVRRIDGDRELGVYVKGLRLAAALDQKERTKWTEMTTGEPAPELEIVSAPAAPPLPAIDDRPDVLIVLLDAARANHFGAYGYERATSPEFDALAAESLRMENVYSNAPFTLISVSSLFTGHNWRDHGVVEKGHALSDRFTTLAEIFRDAGYTTLGWSDNPYVGGATNLDRGFNEFTEVWCHPRQEEVQHLLGKDKDRHEDLRVPELVDMFFLERIAEGLGDGPVFSYVHIMPPHGPYVPGAEHDIFSDPGYDGRICGSTEQITALENHRLEIDDADLHELVALYDGNLHRGDASLGRVVKGWRSLGRDRELLLVVLADHGEAFGEHGQFAHLSTIHAEMTYVPLLLWPRAAWEESVRSADDLLTLSDIMPLVLRRAGVGVPAGGTWPRRFADVLANGLAEERMQIPSRSFVATNRYGVRTDRWLAIHRGFGEQQLYDLRADPGALVNLRLQEPERYTRMIAGLRATLAAGEGPGAEKVELSDEDEQALKALGY